LRRLRLKGMFAALSVVAHENKWVQNLFRARFAKEQAPGRTHYFRRASSAVCVTELAL